MNLVRELPNAPEPSVQEIVGHSLQRHSDGGRHGLSGHEDTRGNHAFSVPLRVGMICTQDKMNDAAMRLYAHEPGNECVLDWHGLDKRSLPFVVGHGRTPLVTREAYSTKDERQPNETSSFFHNLSHRGTWLPQPKPQPNVLFLRNIGCKSSIPLTPRTVVSVTRRNLPMSGAARSDRTPDAPRDYFNFGWPRVGSSLRDAGLASEESPALNFLSPSRRKRVAMTRQLAGANARIFIQRAFPPRIRFQENLPTDSTDRLPGFYGAGASVFKVSPHVGKHHMKDCSSASNQRKKKANE